MDWLNAFQIPLSLINQAQQDFATFGANLQNEQRYQQGIGELEGLRRRNLSRIDRGAAEANRRAGQITRSGARGVRDLTADVQGRYDDRYTRNMQYLEGQGEQERRDINRAFNNQQSQVNADLTRRGMASSTIMPAARAGVERRRRDAIGGLEERLRGQRIATDAGLSGDAASAAASLGWQGMDFNRQNAMNQLNTGWMTRGAQANNDAALTGGLVNWIGNRQDVAPDQGLFMQLQNQTGSGLAGPVNYPDADGTGAFVGGIAPWAGTFAGKFIADVCVAGDTLIRTGKKKSRPLQFIQVGDTVMTPAGAKRVIGRDFGKTPDERIGDFVEIRTHSGRRVVLTADHKLSGRAAGAYRVPTAIPVWKQGKSYWDTVAAVLPARTPEACGDLVLEGGYPCYLTAAGLEIYCNLTSVEALEEAADVTGGADVDSD